MKWTWEKLKARVDEEIEKGGVLRFHLNGVPGALAMKHLGGAWAAESCYRNYRGYSVYCNPEGDEAIRVTR